MLSLRSLFAFGESKLELIEKTGHDQLNLRNGKLPSSAGLVAVAEGKVVGMGHARLVQVSLVRRGHALAVVAHWIELERFGIDFGIHRVLVVGEGEPRSGRDTRAIFECDVLVSQSLRID